MTSSDLFAGCRLQLSPDAVDVWLVPPKQIPRSANLIDQYRELLSAPELERIARFHFPWKRHVGLVTRAALRLILSCYTQRDPRDWHFVRNSHGRPAIPEHDAGAGIRFSISHSDSLIGLAVTTTHDVGVDIEDATRADFGDVVALARRFFTPAEARHVEFCAPALRRHRFLECWTLKEAYLKALGTGLSAPLAQASFAWQNGERLGVTFDPALPERAASWRFLLAMVPSGRLVATAARVAAGRPLSVRFFAAIPLVREERLADLVWEPPGHRFVLPASPEDALST